MGIEKEVIIDTEDIAKYMYDQLVKRGFVPTIEDVEEIADIVFEFLLARDVIEERE